MNVYKKIRMKLLQQFVVQVNMRVALSTKNKTHYETLGISPNATHNEIKSAYYKLTLKYHPDKNKTESAKSMFQEISNAYSVLGNYKLRKQYDRRIAVKHGKVNIIYKPIYKYNDSKNDDARTKQKIYDFDEWTRAHYQKTFEFDMIRKSRRETLHASEPEPNMSNFGVVSFIGLIFCSIYTLTVYLKIQEDHDIPIDENTK